MICQLCQNQAGDKVTATDAILLRHALLVTAPLYEPAVCEVCYERAMCRMPKLDVENRLLRET